MTRRFVLIEREQHAEGLVARVVINNPDKLNVLNSAVMQEFVSTLAALEHEEDLRALVLTGAGDRAFVGGADIAEMGAITSPDDARAFISRVHACCEAVRRFPVPVIARIQGYTFGAGLELAASCDIRIASDVATFGMPEVKLGIPSVVEAALLPSLVGWGRTREMLLLGERFSAAAARDWRLVERVVPASQLDAAVEECVSVLLTSEPRAVRLQKQLITDWEDRPLREAIDRGIDAFAAAFEGLAPAEAMARFLAEQRARRQARGVDFRSS